MLSVSVQLLHVTDEFYFLQLLLFLVNCRANLVNAGYCNVQKQKCYAFVW